MLKKAIANDILIPEFARLVAEGAKVTFTPQGVSMLPFIRGGRDSVVLVRPVNMRNGDIVLAQTGPAVYVLHRIVEMKGENLTLMGDGNLSGVEKVRCDNVLALVETVIRDGKKVDCRSRSHRCKAEIWRMMKPVRRYLLAVYKRIIL